MTDLAKMKADAEACLKFTWYEAEDIEMGTFTSQHIASCDPRTILKLLAVVEALRRVRFFLDGCVLGVNIVDDALAALESKPATGTQGVEL